MMTTLIAAVGGILIAVGLLAAIIDMLTNRPGGRKTGRTHTEGAGVPQHPAPSAPPLPPAIFDRELHGL